MTPHELFKMSLDIDPIYDLSFLAPEGSHYNHIKELDPETIRSTNSGYGTTRNQYITIHYIKNFKFDSRRVWQLATVFYQSFPVMVIQNAGREGDDHSKRFIVDFEIYKEMVEYIHRISKLKFTFAENQKIDFNKDLEELTAFYGNKLDDYFETYRS